MTREEKQTVLHCLKSMIDEAACEECPLYGMTGTDHCEKDCVRLAINALEQAPCTDAISRQAVLMEIDKYLCGVPFEEKGIDEVIKDLPLVIPAEKVGQWEQFGNFWEDKFKCSECGKEQPKILCGERIIGHWSDYCPNCGAKMASPTGAERSEE